MRTYLVLMILLLLTVLTTSGEALAMEAGGEFQARLSGFVSQDGQFTSDVSESLDLELFLPQGDRYELRYAFRLEKPVQDLLAGEEVSVFTKKLYLKSKFDHYQLTFGRQPVSWSFGSLLNPVDYTIGAVALDEESGSKYTDAIEVYIPFNWNSNLSVVASFPEGFSWDKEEVKWGIRGRMGLKGYDFTMNYVQEASRPVDSVDNPLLQIGAMIPDKRVGLTLKGDVKNLGVYSSLGHYWEEDLGSSRSYLLGADYSYFVNYNTRLNMQLEYLGIELGFLDSTQKATLNMDDTNRLDLLTGGLSYPIDDFSSIALTSMISLDDGSAVLIPSYQNTLPGNLDLKISCSVFLGPPDTLFAPGSLMPQAATSISLSYPF